MSEANNKRYRVGVIGFAHMHVNELVHQFIACGRADIVACADTKPQTPSLTTVEGSRRANLQRALGAPGAPRAYEDYRQLLEKEQPDIVIMCPENARHGEVAEAAARHGAHIVTEKPMAARLDEARRMAAAAQQAKVALAVNWPITWMPAFRKLKQMVDAGDDRRRAPAQMAQSRLAWAAGAWQRASRRDRRLGHGHRRGEGE